MIAGRNSVSSDRTPEDAAPMASLPPEIYAAICDEVEESCTLALLCSTSPLFLDLAQRILYLSVDLRGCGMRAIKSWALAVTRHAHLAQRMHALALKLPDAPTLDTLDAMKIGRALSRCVNLKELRLAGGMPTYRNNYIHAWMVTEGTFRLHKFENLYFANWWSEDFSNAQTEIRVLSIPYCRKLPSFENRLSNVVALGTASLHGLPAGKPLQRVETGLHKDFSPLAQYSQSLTTLNVCGQWIHGDFSISEVLAAIATSLPALLHLGVTELKKESVLHNVKTPTPILQYFRKLETFILHVRNIHRFLDEEPPSPISYDMEIATDIEDLGMAIMNASPTLWRAAIGGEVTSGQEMTRVLMRSSGKIHTFSLVCTYVEPTKKRGPKNIKIEDLKREIRSLKAKLRSQSPTLCSVCAKPLESVPQGDGASKTGSTSQYGITEGDTASSEPADGPDSTADDLGRPFAQLSLKTKYYGSASFFRLLNNTAAMKSKHLGTLQSTHFRRPLFWDTLPWEKEAYDARARYAFPDDALIASLLSLYFTNVHPTMPILHRPSFERSVAEGLHLKDMEFGGTLLSVLAVASRFSNDPRVFADGKTPLSAGFNFALQVQNSQLLSKRSIHEIHTYFLLSLYAFGTSSPRMSWLYLGLGIRCLHEHREFRRKPNGSNADPEYELWKRAYWSYFALDRLMSVFHGWPSGIQTEDFDVEPLLEVDDEYWDRGLTQPPSQPLSALLLRLPRTAVQILGEATHQLYGSEKSKILDPDWEQHTVAELDSAMNNFLDSVPPHLRWDLECPPQDQFFDQSATLYITYNHVLTAIHRPYIQKVNVLAAPSLSICARAARNVIRTADIWLSKRQRLPLPCVTHPVFISGVILVLHMLGTNRAGRTVDNNKDISSAMDIVKYAESRVQPGGRLWDLL
ncbi:Fungal-trans domain-containing protein [Mycena venus]|uniref:Fungal-trans domain-containing protein n=1 Tax=Mycena venus TaxID=2733690 RepID=A0A8H6Y4Z1_9AGAR|nr:Fungal-trans domain-containing protein [Mycena venus]